MLSGIIFQATGGIHDVGARQLDLLRFRPAHAHDGQFHIGSGVAFQQQAGVSQRHIARSHAVDGFQHVVGGQPGLGRGRSGSHAHDADESEFLGQHQAHPGLMRILVLQIVLVLIGIQIAGEWIDRFEQPVQSAQGDALHIRLFHVFALDAVQHFGVDAELRIRPVGRCASAEHGA